MTLKSKENISSKPDFNDYQINQQSDFANYDNGQIFNKMDNLKGSNYDKIFKDLVNRTNICNSQTSNFNNNEDITKSISEKAKEQNCLII